MSRMFLTILIAGLASLMVPSAVDAQITEPRKLSAVPGRTATLEERLVNRLRATTEQQKAYIKFVVAKVKAGKLDTKLVIAIERKATARNRYFPFPFFERALRYEAAKRRVVLPPVQQFVTTKAVAS